MKFPFPLALLIVCAAPLVCAATADTPTQIPIPIDLGPKAYRTGDAIEITEVTATSPRLEQGDSVTVTGTFHLKSQDSARLCLYLTATAGDGRSKVIPDSTVLVEKGQGEYKLKTLIRSPGHLHLTYYDPASGKPIGGTYFGTPEQAKAIAHWNVDYYLESEKPQKSSAEDQEEIVKLRHRVQLLERRLQELSRKFNELH